MTMKAVAAAVLAMAGCGAPVGPTEMRISIQSDLGAPEPIHALFLSLEGSPSPGWGWNPQALPFLLAVTPDAQRRPFSISVHLSSAEADPDGLFLVRNLRDVSFVGGEVRMLVLSMPGKCACHGTSCPSPGDPDCDDLIAPATTPIDDVTAAAVPDGVFALDMGPRH
jgi:hypothetical protein